MTEWGEKSDALARTLIEDLETKVCRMQDVVKVLKSFPEARLNALIEGNKNEILTAIETLDARNLRFIIQRDRYLRLKAMKFRELRKIASDLAVKYYNKLNTDELIKAIIEKERQLNEAKY